MREVARAVRVRVGKAVARFRPRWSGGGRRVGRTGRASARIAVVLAVAVLVAAGVPPANVTRSQRGLLPISWLWSWLGPLAGWGSPAMPPTPVQQGGTAAGLPHYVSSAATRSRRPPTGTGRKPGKAAGELSPSQPHVRQVKPFATGTLPGDQSFNPQISRRVPAAGSATSTLYANVDGSFTRITYPDPVNYRVADGSWQPVDASLVAGAGGRWGQRANAPGLSVAGSANDPALVSVRPDAAHEVSLGLSGAAPVPATVSGATASYPSVSADTDAVVSSLPSGATVSLVLNSSQAGGTWDLPLRDVGVVPRIDTDGSVRFTDAGGSVLASLAAGVMVDSVTTGAGPAASSAVSYRLVTDSTGAVRLRVSADHSWLTDRSRVFPVTVSLALRSTVLAGPSQAGTEWSAGPPRNATQWPAGAPRALTRGVAGPAVGALLSTGAFDSGRTRATSTMAFPDVASGYPGHRAMAVSLHLFAVWAGDCSIRTVSVSDAVNRRVGSLSVRPDKACGNSSRDPGQGVWMSVPLSPDAVGVGLAGSSSSQASGTPSPSSTPRGSATPSPSATAPATPPAASPVSPGGGARLAVDTPAGTAGQAMQFASTGGGNAPFVAVTFAAANVAPQVDSQYPPDNYASPTLTPELLATGHDPDKGPSSLQFDFVVFNSSGTQIATSGNIATGNWTIPAGVLAWNQFYSWTVQTFDGSTFSASPVFNYFTTPVPQPLITSGLSQNTDEHGFDASIGNYTTSATDAQVATVGPELAVQRDYNSLDPRTASAFGAGWWSVFDMRATEQTNPAGAVATLVISYPDGQEVAFGRNNDGSFASAPGRFAMIAPVTGGGYTMTDKNDTVYRFTQSLGSGGYAITSITDSAGRVETFGYSGGQLSTATSASGRALHLSWSTPIGASAPHISTVVTDPVVAGTPSSALTWTYSYTGDSLSVVCPPTSATACTRYGYGAGSRYASVAMNAGPHSYWRLNESSGTTAASAVVANEGVDNATYANTTLGQPGPMAGSTSTAAGFNGSSAYVKLPNSLVSSTSYQAISLWFKTSTPNGVLFSYQADPVSNPSTTGNYTPSLYVGSDGKLLGEFWYSGLTNPIVSGGAVTDGKWHHVVLTASGSTQSMYLDGGLVGSKSGVISLFQAGGVTNEYVGAGFVGGAWPDEPHMNQSGNTGFATFFNGSISDVGFYSQPLSAAAITALYSAASGAQLMTSVTRPSGNTFAGVSYDQVSGRVSQVTDEHGGVWKLGSPSVSGSSQVYVSSVLGASPVDYWRLNDAASSQVNPVVGYPAAYNSVTLGVSGPFSDDSAASFNGTSSYIASTRNPFSTSGYESIGLWFKTTTGNGVLFGYSFDPLTTATSTDYTPLLYVGTDGRLFGGWGASSASPISTSKSVADGGWHQVVLTYGQGTRQALYLDGALVGTAAGSYNPSTSANVTIGGGFLGGLYPDEPHHSTSLGTGFPTYFNGSIAEVAEYASPTQSSAQLSDAMVATQYAAFKSSSGVAPVQTITVTDPGGKTVSYSHDLLDGDRLISQTDTLGNTTRYGYDTSGFLNTVTDPNGSVVTTGHDVRGNVVSQTSCQFQANFCGTAYFTYYPDDTSTTLTPDPRNDQLLTVRDARSASATDNTYLTSYSYDSSGNRTAVTTPPVDGYPSGRTATIAYTTAATPAADGGTTLSGLPATMTSPGGAAQQATYDKNGDLAQVVDAAGLVTKYTYDGVGRMLTKTEVSDSYPAGLTTSYTYDGVGQVVSETDPPVTNRVTGAIHTAQTTTVYDADGNVTGQTVADTSGGDASRTVSTTYNSAGEVATSTDAAGAVTTFGYDSYGNRIKQVDAAGTETDFGFDAEGHLLTTTLVNFTGDPANPSPATNLVESSRAYDPGGRLASVTDAMGRQTNYYYDDNGPLTGVYRCTSDQSACDFLNKQYDLAGNLTSQETNTGLTQYTVDAANRVTTSVLDPHLSAGDGAVNRISRYLFNPDDAVLSTSQSDLSGASQVVDATYDPLGRMTSQSVHNNGAGYPVGWWKLAENGGSAAADSALTQTGTLNSGVSLSGGAATFNGTSGAITTDGPVLDTTGSFTVSAWVNLANLTATQTAVSQDTGSDMFGFALQYNKADNRWSFARALTDTPNASTARAESAAAPTAGTWTHLVGVFDASAGAMTLYVNGAPAGSGSDPTPVAATGVLTIGRDQTNGQPADFLSGSVSNVQVYSRVLSAAEVGTLFGNGRTGAALGGDNKLTTTWTLDKRGLPTTMVDPNGNTTSYTYDEAGRQAVTVAPTVNTEVNGGTPVATHPVSMTGYDTFGARTETSDPNGNVTTTGYDAAGREVSTKLPPYTPPGGVTINAVQSHTYDSLGQVSSDTDALGNTTHYGYDQLGDLATITDPTGAVTHYTYDTAGERLSSTDPTGAVTQATYDIFGHQLTSTQVVRQPSAAAYTTTYTYYPSNLRLATATTPAGGVTNYSYNNVGELTDVTDPVGNTTSYGYDFAGRTVSTKAPDGTRHTLTYDQAGRLSATSNLDTNGTVLAGTSSTYDNNGDPIAVTDARGATSTFTYDATGLPSTEVQPVTATTAITTSFGYDAAGNRTRYTDGRNNPFLTTYTSWNLPESQIEPPTAAFPNLADRTFTAVYDANGRLARQVLPGGVAVTNTYNTLGDLTAQTGTGADAPTTARSFGYDPAGRVTSASAPGGTDNFSYDDRGLLTSASGPSGSSSFSYTPDGLMATRTDAAGSSTYTYDTADRLATASDPATGTQLSFNYTANSQVSRIVYGAGGNVRSFGYDGLHRLTSDSLATAAGATVASIGYGYDPNGNVTSKTTSGFAGSGSNTYTYDLANRLTSWNNGTTTVGYGYDASGNRTQVGAQTFSYDARDQLLTGGGASYTYTARGTLASTVGASGTVTSTSDAFGQTITQGTQTYTYDGLGRVVTDTTGTGGATTTLAYSGAENLVAADGTATYSHDPGGGLLGVHVGSTGTLALTDAHTDLVGQFIASGASLSGSASYDPLGNVTAASNMAGNVGFQSEWTDHSTGRVNMLTRWYNPATGQFDNRDATTLSPVPTSVSTNRFAYIDDNPLGGTDPTGQCGTFDLVCKAKKLAHKVTKAVSTAWNDASSAASRAWDYAQHAAQQIYNVGVQVVRTVVKTVRNVTHTVVHYVRDAYHKVKRVVTRTIQQIRKTVTHYTKTVVHAVKTAYHQTAKAVSAGVNFAVHHAAAIASLVASTVVFMGCEAGLATISGGIGAIPGAVVCGALAGAIGNVIGYEVNAVQKGHFSWSGWAKAGLVGAGAGAVGGLFGGLGGKAASWLGGKAVGALSDLFTSGAEDATTTATEQAATEGTTDAAATAGREAGDGAAGGVERTPTRAQSSSDAAAGRGEPAHATSGEPSAPAQPRPTTPSCHSFAPSTLVVMADGSTKPIKDIKIGDKLAVTDPATGKTTTEPVGVLHDNHDTDLVDVDVRAADGSTSTLHTTAHHPFWDSGSSRWVEAAALRSGTRLQTLDGQSATVLGVHDRPGTQDMRDLTLIDIHTYYVIAGDQPVLVHNCGGLDWSRAKVNEGGVNAVERHLLRFTDGGPLEPAEQGMLDRLRSIASGDLEATPHDLRFYTHELRESVLYRKAGYSTGQPQVDSYELWDQLHTEALNDYGLTRAGAASDLYHPSVGR